MKHLQAFKYELQPNGEQSRVMCRFTTLSDGSHIEPLNRFRNIKNALPDISELCRVKRSSVSAVGVAVFFLGNQLC
jgi:hypothetical protein